jgi:hypothetical protein
MTGFVMGFGDLVFCSMLRLSLPTLSQAFPRKSCDKGGATAFLHLAATLFIDCGGGGPTRSQDAGRGARAFDALLRRSLLCGEIPQ